MEFVSNVKCHGDVLVIVGVVWFSRHIFFMHCSYLLKNSLCFAINPFNKCRKKATKTFDPSNNMVDMECVISQFHNK